MPYSVVFCGTSAFAVPSLQALAAAKEFSLQLVVTQPDREAGRSQKLTSSAVKITALELGLAVIQPQNINDESSSQLVTRNPQPDFLIVVSYGQILKPAILSLPSIAAINVHASLLPRWRGASPMQHAILHGDAETGVTVQRMAEKLDAGAILGQRGTPIGPRETFTELHDRLAVIGAELLVETLLHPLREHTQNDSAASVCRKLSRTDGIVDPRTMTAEEIDRRVRALIPWPGVSCDAGALIPGAAKVPVKILAASVVPVDSALAVACKNGTILHIITVQPAGKRVMSATAWQRGFRSIGQ